MDTASRTYSSFESVRPYKIWPGVLAHAVGGDQVSFALVELEPNVRVAEHSHPNEQAGFIIQGSFTFTIGGETRDLKPGDTYLIPGGVPHSAAAGPEGTVALDIFSPPRDDWEALERAEPTRPSWPPGSRDRNFLTSDPRARLLSQLSDRFPGERMGVCSGDGGNSAGI
jgi:quercetin dioxygenase-like cupin family protein